MAIDAAGYLLLLAAALTGWLPGPGGIPLALAGLGLLSINNQWAKSLREYLLKNGGKIVQIAFPKHWAVELLYDVIVIVLFGIAAILGYRHSAFWEVSLATAAFFFALFVGLMNRDRFNRVRNKHKY